MLTLQMLEAMPSGTIFAQGKIVDSPKGINMDNTGQLLSWVAKKGGGDDWAIYCHFADHSIDYIVHHGNKVTSKQNILTLVPCNEEALERYRY